MSKNPVDEMKDAFGEYETAISNAQRRFHNYQEWEEEDIAPIDAARNKFYAAYQAATTLSQADRELLNAKCKRCGRPASVGRDACESCWLGWQMANDRGNRLPFLEWATAFPGGMGETGEAVEAGATRHERLRGVKPK